VKNAVSPLFLRITGLRGIHVDYEWLGSATLRDALDRLVRHQKLISTAVDLALESHDSEVHYVIRRPDMPPQAADAASFVAVQVCRDVGRDDCAPLGVQTPAKNSIARAGACERYSRPRNYWIFLMQNIEDCFADKAICRS
jgi:hypothetical protein